MHKLGLIGQSIAQSRSPALHVMLGEELGVPVTYDLHEPVDSSPEAFTKTLEKLRLQGYQGTNVTFPYKQLAVAEADRVGPSARLIGSTNTLALAEGIGAFNTDYSGFIRGYRHRIGDCAAGRVVLVGAGGVGRAVAFALFELGATEIQVFDLSPASASSLAASLSDAGYRASVVDAGDLESAVRGADGLVNCTPVGHYKTPGTPVAENWIGSQRWAFDAVYTPIDTEFMTRCYQAGLAIVSGFDLFIYQGMDAFEIFTDQKIETPEPIIRRFRERFELRSALLG